jgi:hypothetical protein
MELDADDLRNGRDPFHAVYLKIRLAVAGNLHKVKEARGALKGVALEKAVGGDPLWSAHQRARAPPDMADHPLAYPFEIMGKLELGHRAAFVGLRP